MGVAVSAFKLERALRSLNVERTLAHRDLLEVERTRDRVVGALRSAERRHEDTLALWSSDPRANAALQRVARGAAVRIEREISGLEAHLARFDQHQLVPAKSRLDGASRQHRSVEALLERRLAAEAHSEAQRESKGLDEVAQRRWLRQSS